MFGAGPPPPSAEEVRDQELAAKKSIQAVLGTCLVLYLSPFFAGYAKEFVSSMI
ncbi:hypothetical protein DFP73DRAFT_554997 [Morchella snyderi]|nr:hypothetical protein DFP73DRAFT_554997 [Morchella snyderi]